MKITGGKLKYSIDKEIKEVAFTNNFTGEDLDITFSFKEGEKNSNLKVSLKPKHEITVKSFYLSTDAELSSDSLVFLNGYQTWTESREFTLNESIPKLRKLVWSIMNMYGDYGFYPTEKNKLHSWTYTYLREKEGIFFLGSKKENTGYTIFQYDKKYKTLNIIKDCKGLVLDKSFEAFNLFLAQGYENDIFDRYFAFCELPKPKVKPCTGWTSWYNYYTTISEKITLENLAAFKSRNIPIDTFQIDDGYQQSVGDWLDINDKFPRGMKFIAEEIKKCGYSSGLWLAPFICEKKSKIYKEHPEWVTGRAGINPGWSGIFYALDIYNQDFRAYLKKVFSVVLNDWGFDMVKLDFLYAAIISQKPDKTRGEVMYDAMKFIREIVGDKLILGCGVPLGCAFGLVDYCRIGSDVALMWEDKILKGLHYRERVSTINSITSSIGRRHLNGRAFLNDPDVFIIRSTGNKLTKDQRYTLLLINLIFGGLVFTSDNINEYSEEELLLYKSIFPIKEKKITKVIYASAVKIYFSIQAEDYIVLSNLEDKNAKIILEEGGYFSNGTGITASNMEIELKPYQSICLIKIKDDTLRLRESNNIFML